MPDKHEVVELDAGQEIVTQYLDPRCVFKRVFNLLVCFCAPQSHNLVVQCSGDELEGPIERDDEQGNPVT
jgi:hypothetical protein